MNKKRLMFMGTPDFAIPCLEMLNNREDTEIVSVVTQPDRQSGRGYKVTYPPVKSFALDHDLEVIQPDSVKDEAFRKYLGEKSPDIIVVIAYGRILPDFVLEYPEFGCINVHASLLPKYRGAAPIQWSVINGEKKTGVTTMYMDKGLDTGDKIMTREVYLDEYETSGSLFEKLAGISVNVLSDTIDALYAGTAVREKQNHDEMTYAPMISKEMSYIDFNKSAQEVCCLIRGLNPSPGAKIKVKDKIVKIFMAKPACVVCDKMSGTVIECKERIVISCGEGTAIEIIELQPEGKRRMDVSEFLKGNSLIEENDVIGGNV